MNQNYMNYFNAGTSPGASGASNNGGNNDGIGDYTNQQNFLGSNMPSSGGSFMDMINSAPPPIMNTPTQQVNRFNQPYNNMYGQGGYSGMENSAMRLQQFANRQMVPRHGFDMNQMNQEQMNQYYMQMRKMRMMQEYNSQARYSNPNAGWPRNFITNMPPNLQQMSPQPRMNSMMHSSGYNTNTNSAIRMQNLPNQQYQQAGAYRKNAYP